MNLKDFLETFDKVNIALYKHFYLKISLCYFMTVRNNSHFVSVAQFLSVCIVLYSWMYHKMALMAFYTLTVDIVSLFMEVANKSTYTTKCLETSPMVFGTVTIDFYSNFCYRDLVYHHLVTDFTNHFINYCDILIANSSNLSLLSINTADIANCNWSHRQISPEMVLK